MTALCPICLVPIGTCFPPREAPETDGEVGYGYNKKSGPAGNRTLAENDWKGVAMADTNTTRSQTLTGPTSVADILRDAATKPGPLGDIARRAGLRPFVEIPADLRPRDYYTITTPLGHWRER